MKHVVITGGSRGIGAAAVELFSGRGDRVTFLYEKEHEAARLVAQRTGATAICCDVADGQAVKSAFDTIHSFRFGMAYLRGTFSMGGYKTASYNVSAKQYLIFSS